MLCTKRAGWGVLDKDPNPASATHNDIASCNSTSHVVFFVLYCDKPATRQTARQPFFVETFCYNHNKAITLQSEKY